MQAAAPKNIYTHNRLHCIVTLLSIFSHFKIYKSIKLRTFPARCQRWRWSQWWNYLQPCRNILGTKTLHEILGERESISSSMQVIDQNYANVYRTKCSIRSIVCEASRHAVTLSLGHLVTWSLGHLVTWSLGHLVTRSLRHSVTWSLSPSVPQSLGPSVTWSLGYSITLSLGNQCCNERTN